MKKRRKEEIKSSKVIIQIKSKPPVKNEVKKYMEVEIEGK